MQLLKRKKADPSFVISIESGVEEVREVKVHQECDYLVDVLTGKRSVVSPDFCCKMLYMIFCTCFTNESNQRKTGTTVMARSVASSSTTITQRLLTYQNI
ncbi:uncharacterized protein LOC126568622 [Anopheles maculipalpis]|uniref:uncharacterized protein LOC126568622 n=1 Tax=Anopheles maculipalpis TaxID=1496333 RepID=UPI00215992DA|nr:uncharacterized protein LOC126568622 [Anopheles maculipalpis]